MILGDTIKGVISDENTANITMEPGFFYGNSYPALYQNHIIIVLRVGLSHCQIAISMEGKNIKFRCVYNKDTFSGIEWKTI